MNPRSHVKALIGEAARQLEDHQVDAPELNARMLLAHVLDRAEWELSLYRSPIRKEEEDRFWKLIQERCRRIPLQHLIGEVGFYGLDLQVSNAALIPRPETEILVDTCLGLIRASHQEERPLRILDMATGTGCIALALAKALPQAEVWGVDISSDALELARKNAQRTGLDHRVRFIHSDLWTAFEGESRSWDGVVSNPPYIPSAEIETLDPEVRDHDPRLALDGGEDGLVFYRAIAEQAPRWMTSDGWLVLECGMDQAPAIKNVFQTGSWFADQVVRDYNNVQRILVFRKGKPSSRLTS